MDKKTPLYECHIERNAKIVPFAGYLLPVQYETGVINEHNAVRNAAGLFDVSHMGEVIISGNDALLNLQMLVTNDCSKMYDGQAKYSPMCNFEGGTVDDLIVFKINNNKFLLGINAANRDKDVDWIKSHLKGDASLLDISDDVAQVALQGRASKAILEKICDKKTLPEKYYSFRENVNVSGINCFVSKTGYTGEEGYEISCKPEDARKLWDSVLEAGAPEDLIPCGLGARDTLRLEAAMPLYGHELTDDITPLEAGLNFAVKTEKQDFIGKDAMIKRGEMRIRTGLKITGRGIAREHCEVFLGDMNIGFTTSGTHSPTLGYPVAMAMLNKEYATFGTEVDVDVRGRRISALVCELPFYRRK